MAKGEDWEKRALEYTGTTGLTEMSAPDDKLSAICQEFLVNAALEPTPDAVGQLRDAFLPALRIMCERGYDRHGLTWREGGWMPIVIEIKKKTGRLWFRCWRNGKPPWIEDHPLDLVNYAGMLVRSEGMTPWGEWGHPHTDDVE